MAENPVITTTVTGTISATILAAILRGGGQGFWNAAIAILTTHQLGLSWDEALTAGGIVFFTALGGRAAIEGTIDSIRQAKGNVASSDIQPNPEPVKP